MNGRKRKLLRYIEENPFTSNYCKVAKKVCGYPQRAKKDHNTMSRAMLELWMDGNLEGIRVNKKWIYVSTHQTT